MNKWKVDIREPENLINYFKDKGAEVTALDVGDYLYNDIVAFERKSDDFCDFDHMFVQVDELINTYPFPFLVVDKKLDEIVMNANKTFHRNMLPLILGAVASLSVRGCPPLFFGNQTLMLTTMEKIAEKCLDGKDRTAKRMLRVRSLDQRENVALNVLRAFGVGSGRAEDIAKRYDGDVKKILEIITTNTNEFKEVSGVGDKTIEQIKESLKKKQKIVLDEKQYKTVPCENCGGKIEVFEWEVTADCPKCGTKNWVIK